MKIEGLELFEHYEIICNDIGDLIIEDEKYLNEYTIVDELDKEEYEELKEDLEFMKSMHEWLVHKRDTEYLSYCENSFE